MRRAIPYPWRGPRTSRVLSTISASVPCRTSVSFIGSVWVSNRNDDRRPLGKQQGSFGWYPLPRSFCPSLHARSSEGSDPMRAALALLSTLALVVAFPAAQTRATKSLDIYVVDVEGGNAQLWVTPSAESVLVDTGHAGAPAARDAART